MTTLVDNPWNLFPQHRHLGTEESGNEIVVDTASGDAGPVFGLWHDPPAVVILARNEQELRALAPDMSADNTITLPAAVHARLDAALLWGRSNAMTIDAARSKLGIAYADWLSGLPPDATIHDLRAAEPGTGFEWTDRTTFTRHPASAVFASVTPPAKPGFFKRLFG
jgi:hypothetical protein